jgi:hypothetical protein
MKQRRRGRRESPSEGICPPSPCLHVGRKHVVQGWAAAVVHDVEVGHAQAAVVVQPLREVDVLVCKQGQQSINAEC